MGASVCRARHRNVDVAPNAPADGSLPVSPTPALPRCLRQVRSGRPPLALCHLRSGAPPCPAFDGFRSVFSDLKVDAAPVVLDDQNGTAAKADAETDSVRTVFFFHGVGGSCDVFFFQIGCLHRMGYEIVAMDLMGHGRSPAGQNSSDYAFESLWADALSLFDDLAAPGAGNAVVGHSYGTAFAARLCVERSKRISRSVLIAGGGPSALGGVPACLKAGNGCCCLCCCCCCGCCCGKAFARCIARCLAFGSHSQPPLGRRSSPAVLEAPARVLAWTLIGQDWPEGGVDYHALISLPVLLVHGCEDRLVSLDDEEWMLETLPLARLVRVPNAGHLATLEAPEILNAHLLRFLRSRSPVGHGRVPPLPAPGGAGVVASADSQDRQRQRRQQLRRERRCYAVDDRELGVDNPAMEMEIS